MADTATVKKQALLRLIRLKTSIARLHLDTFQEAVDDLSKEVEEANHTLKAGGTGDIEEATMSLVDLAAAEAGDGSIADLKRDAENLAGEITALAEKLRVKSPNAITDSLWVEDGETDQSKTTTLDPKRPEVEVSGAVKAKNLEGETHLSAQIAIQESGDYALFPDIETDHPVLNPLTLNAYSSYTNPISWSSLHALLAIRTKILPRTKNHTLVEAEAALNTVWREHLAIQAELLRVYPTDPTAPDASVPLDKAKTRNLMSVMAQRSNTVNEAVGEENLEEVTKVLCAVGLLADAEGRKSTLRVTQVISHSLDIRAKEAAEQMEMEKVKGQKKKRARRGKKGKVAVGVEDGDDAPEHVGAVMEHGQASEGVDKGKARAEPDTEAAGQDGTAGKGAKDYESRGGKPVSFNVGKGTLVMADHCNPEQILEFLKEKLG